MPWGRQIDRLVARFTGQGSATSARFRLPRARYTVFVSYDPADTARRFSISTESGQSWPDWSGLPAAGFVTAPVVQELLPAGMYHVEVETSTPTCAWDVEVVLNSMQSVGRPPPEWEQPSPPPAATTVRSDGPSSLSLGRTGTYLVDWTVGDDRPGPRRTIHPYSLRLRAADGHAVDLGAASEGRDRRIDRVFLGAGEWVVEMETDVRWECVLTAVVGPTGGGSRGF